MMVKSNPFSSRLNKIKYLKDQIMIFYDLGTLARIILNLKEKIRYELFDNIM